MDIYDTTLQCPQCRGNDIAGHKPVEDTYQCRVCGFTGIYLNFIFWNYKFSGDNQYLMVN